MSPIDENHIFSWRPHCRFPLKVKKPSIGTIWDEGLNKSLGNSLARRALIRGAGLRNRYDVAGWTAPSVPAAREWRLPALRAMMWVHVFDGQRLAVLLGWADTDSMHPRPSILSRPAETEIIAHTSLDMLRLKDYLAAFEETPIIAFDGGEDLLAHEITSESGNSWASWVVPIWDTLLSRQIRYDLVPRNPIVCDVGLDESLNSYKSVIPLDRPPDGQADWLIKKIERRLAQVEEHVYRLTAREMDGTIASDVYVRAGRTPEGKACAAVVNLSDRPRVLKLRGSPAIGASRDEISDQPISEPDQRLEFAPWQVRLLWPTE